MKQINRTKPKATAIIMDHADTSTAASTTSAMISVAKHNATGAAASPRAVSLLIENPGKGKNWGPLLRCCAAFGIETIYVIGYDQCDVRGSHGASKHVRLKAFPTVGQASAAIRAGGFELVGLLSQPPLGNGGWDYDSNDDDYDEIRSVVKEEFYYEPAKTKLEIVRIAAAAAAAARKNGDGDTDTKERATNHNSDATTTTITPYHNKHSIPVHLRNKLPPKLCLVVDKVKRGLPWSLANHCSSFVHIPHFNCNISSNGGSMLTLEASVSIVFHELCNAGWVGHTEKNDDIHSENVVSNQSSNDTTTNYKGQKYDVAKIHKGDLEDTKQRQRKRKEREEKLQALREEADDEELLQSSSIFGNNTNDGDDY